MAVGEERGKLPVLLLRPRGVALLLLLLVAEAAVLCRGVLAAEREGPRSAYSASLLCTTELGAEPWAWRE